MTRVWTALAIGGATIVTAMIVMTSRAPLLAHHSFAVTYLEADTVEIEGDVVEFQYKNPHSVIFVQGTEGFGRSKLYAAEWVSV